MCICMSVYHTCVQVASRGQKRTLDPREVGLQMGVSSWMWVLGTELRFSARAANVLYLWVIFPTLKPQLLSL